MFAELAHFSESSLRGALCQLGVQLVRQRFPSPHRFQSIDGYTHRRQGRCAANAHGTGGHPFGRKAQGPSHSTEEGLKLFVSDGRTVRILEHRCVGTFVRGILPGTSEPVHRRCGESGGMKPNNFPTIKMIVFGAPEVDVSIAAGPRNVVAKKQSVLGSAEYQVGSTEHAVDTCAGHCE
jgi:hypothetical protein